MKNYTGSFSTQVTPQSQPIPGKAQVKNNAGGFVYEVGPFNRLERFLILGVEGNTFYQKEGALIVENATNAVACIKSDPKRVVDMVVAVSTEGRAHKNDPALFVLAMAAGMASAEGKKYALDNLGKVARTGTHLFTFVEYVQHFRGWGRGLRDAISKWYLSKPVDRMAFQMCKYRQRGGWSHMDLLRLSHAIPDTETRSAVFKWIVGKGDAPVGVEPIRAFTSLQQASSEEQVISLLTETKAPWEFVPTEYLSNPNVLKTLLPNMPMTALVRQLAKMTAYGVIAPMTAELDHVVKQLHNKEYIQESRLHPLSVLIAMSTYANGKGEKGKLTWAPVQQVVDALNDAFYLAFKNVTPTGKRIRLGVDVSGSMTNWYASGCASLSCRTAAAAMALVTASVEPNYEIYGFSDTFRPLAISPGMRLDSAIKVMSNLPFARTDCALPMVHASQTKVDRDAFIIYTDNETWCGNIHPSQALEQYRKYRVSNAKLAVVAMAGTNFTIADPNDPGSMDFVGFDAGTPAAISSFLSE